MINSNKSRHDLNLLLVELLALIITFGPFEKKNILGIYYNRCIFDKISMKCCSLINRLMVQGIYQTCLLQNVCFLKNYSKDKISQNYFTLDLFSTRILRCST